MLRLDLKNITIESLRTSNQISVRTANCCYNKGFETLYDIISYYEHGNSFLNLRNVGKLTSRELECLCENYSDTESDLIEPILKSKNAIIINKSDGELLYQSFNNDQRQLIEQKYLELLSLCTVRTYNALRNIKANEFFKSYIFCDSNDFFKLKNIGKKSIKEIIDFRSKINSYTNEIIHFDAIPFQNILKNSITKYEYFCSKDFLTNFYEKHSHLPMIWILEQYIINDKSKKNEILLDAINVFQNRQLLSNKEIAQKHELTRERVRQLRESFFDNYFITPIAEVTNRQIFNIRKGFIKYKDDWQYILGRISHIDILHKESSEIKIIIEQEKSNFSFEFFLQIISFIFHDIYSLFGGVNISKKDRRWNNTFIIRKEYCSLFDFDKTRQEFCNILLDNKMEYFLDIKNYVANSKSWKNFDFSKLEEVTNIVKEILLMEFGLYSEEIDGQIKIPANKKRNIINVVYEILKQKGNPMHLNEIFLEFRRILPDHKYTEATQLRPWLQKNELISFRNRSSIYTLKEWKHIRTGTIRDAIIEFLIKYDSPQTADDITNFVLIHFPKTNISSVRTSMLNDTLNRFRFFGNNLFGLTSKEYSNEYEEVEQQNGLRKTFEQRLIDLEKFIVENEHFPFASSEDKEEESLCRWWNRVKNNKQQFSSNQLTEIERVKYQYNEYEEDRETYEWKMNYIKFKLFLIENRRIPFAKGNEKFLYLWFRKAKLDFLNYRLSGEQRKKYIELAKLI